MESKSISSLVDFVDQYFSTIVVASLALLAVKYSLEWLRRYLLLFSVPGPSAGFPPQFLIKCIQIKPWPEITWFIRHTVEDYADTDDGVSKVYIGFTPVVFLSSANSVGALLSDTVNLSKPMAYKFLEGYIPDSIITVTGDFHKFQRKLFTPAFNSRTLDDFVGLMNKHSADFVTYLSQKPMEQEIHLFEEFGKCTMNIIAETSLGHDIKAFSGDNRYGKALTMLQALVLIRSIRPWVWFDAIYYNFSNHGSLFKQCVKSMRTLSTPIMEKRLHEHEEELAKREEAKLNGESQPSPAEKRKQRTFLRIMLDAHFQNPELVPKKLIQTAVDSALFGGQDTTAAALSWLMYLLGLHPDVQEKCRQEMFNILGPDAFSPVDIDHLKHMTYLEATFKEAMRTYAAVPLVGRLLEKDIEIKGKHRNYTLPAGVQVIASIFHLHRDPRYFPDPEKFDPERFLDKNAPHRAHPFAYVPFSAGPRSCLGQKFALYEVKIMMAYVLRSFEWTSTQSRDDFTLRFEIVSKVRGDLRAMFKPLHSMETV